MQSAIGGVWRSCRGPAMTAKLPIGRRRDGELFGAIDTMPPNLAPPRVQREQPRYGSIWSRASCLSADVQNVPNGRAAPPWAYLRFRSQGNTCYYMNDSRANKLRFRWAPSSLLTRVVMIILNQQQWKQPLCPRIQRKRDVTLQRALASHWMLQSDGAAWQAPLAWTYSVYYSEQLSRKCFRNAMYGD